MSPEDFPKLCAEMNIDIISLDAVSSSTYHHLRATYHRDPFDRMLIWQAKHLQTPIISRDKTVKLYESEGIHVVW